MIFTRPQIDFIQDLINRSRAEARVFTHRLVSQVTDEKHAHSFPVVPVVFLGPYTDEFVTRSMLASPKGYQYSDAALAAAGWLALSASATGSPTYVYAGSVRGPFLPHNSPWTVTIKVTGCGTLYNKAGLKIRQGAFADGWTGNAGIGPSCYNYLWHQTTSLFRLYYGDASANGYTDIAALPSRTTPLYLRIAQTFPGGTRTLTYSWRLGDAGNFTAAKTTTPGANYWTDSLDLGPLAGSTNTVAISVEFDNLTVNYTPDGAPDDYAFIPTSSFDNYTKDHIYVKRTDNTYLRIEPQPWMIVSAYGLLWRYDSGSGWVILEIPHNTLSNILPDDHHAKQHGLSDTANHSGVSGTTDNFLARDVNGLPKDSGYSAASFAPARHDLVSANHTGKDRLWCAPGLWFELVDTLKFKVRRTVIGSTDEHSAIIAFLDDKTCDLTTTGAGGLDTGTVAKDTYYYVWACSGSSGTCLLASLSDAEPTVPSGYDDTYFLIGMIKTGAGILPILYTYWSFDEGTGTLVASNRGTPWTRLYKNSAASCQWDTTWSPWGNACAYHSGASYTAWNNPATPMRGEFSPEKQMKFTMSCWVSNPKNDLHSGPYCGITFTPYALDRGGYYDTSGVKQAVQFNTGNNQPYTQIAADPGKWFLITQFRVSGNTIQCAKWARKLGTSTWYGHDWLSTGITNATSLSTYNDLLTLYTGYGSAACYFDEFAAYPGWCPTADDRDAMFAASIADWGSACLLLPQVVSAGAGNLLMSGSSGATAEDTGFPASALYWDARNNFAVPMAGTSITTASGCTLLGVTAGCSISSGENHTIVGYSAGASITTSVWGSTAIGSNALYYENSGNGNVAVGHRSALWLRGGSWNVIVGADAAGQYGGITTGVNYSNSVFIGYGTARHPQTASQDVIIGTYAGRYVGNGQENTWLGYNAGYAAHNVSKSEFLGSRSDVSLFVPGSVTRTLQAGAGMGTGVYYYKYAWVFSINGVTVEGPITLPFDITTTSGYNQVVHSNFPTYSGPLNCTGVKIYRTVVGGTYYGTFKLVDTAVGNPPASYTDVKADGALGATLVEHTGMLGIGYHSDVLKSNSIVMGSPESPFTDLWIGGGMYMSSPAQVNIYATGGQGANNAGANLCIAGGQGTGSASGGAILFKTSPAGSTGSTWNDLVEVARFTAGGELLFAASKTLDLYSNTGILKVPYSEQSGLPTLATGELRITKDTSSGKKYLVFATPDGTYSVEAT